MAVRSSHTHSTWKQTLCGMSSSKSTRGSAPQEHAGPHQHASMAARHAGVHVQTGALEVRTSNEDIVRVLAAVRCLRHQHMRPRAEVLATKNTGRTQSMHQCASTASLKRPSSRMTTTLQRSRPSSPLRKRCGYPSPSAPAPPKAHACTQASFLQHQRSSRTPRRAGCGSVEHL